MWYLLVLCMVLGVCLSLLVVLGMFIICLILPSLAMSVFLLGIRIIRRLPYHRRPMLRRSRPFTSLLTLTFIFAFAFTVTLTNHRTRTRIRLVSKPLARKRIRKLRC